MDDVIAEGSSENRRTGDHGSDKPTQGIGLNSNCAVGDYEAWGVDG